MERYKSNPPHRKNDLEFRVASNPKKLHIHWKPTVERIFHLPKWFNDNRKLSKSYIMVTVFDKTDLDLTYNETDVE
jgi:hypothetical protein